MEKWLPIDLIIVSCYGLQHSLLTTKRAVALFNKSFPDYTWNIIYSVISLLILVAGFYFWRSSGIYIFYLRPGSILFHLSVISLSLSLFLFFYCFKYTTSFWQWLGIKQIVVKLAGKKMPEYYRVRKGGIKRYVRFPHHTCLVVLLWTHPVMTVDTLFLAIAGTIYLYIGTYHQDLRGLRVIGEEWAIYRRETDLLFPRPQTLRRMFRDMFSDSPVAHSVPTSASVSAEIVADHAVPASVRERL